MNITTISEHSVCLDLLPAEARILDAGCRGFEFTNYFRERGHQVLAIDIDELPEGNKYLLAGIGYTSGKAGVSESADPQARRLTHPVPGKPEVDVYNIEQLKALAGGPFDLIKMDVEGEELAILNAAAHPMAKQVSVEFHAHCTLQTRAQLDTLLDWLSRWYTVCNRVWENRHGAGFNYWDILLIAK